MKKVLLFISFFLYTLSINAQNRNSVVKLLNNYIEYSNANITALSIAINSFERYNGLFNDYLRQNRKLGGEEFEKPKLSPFLDEDIFTMNENNPDFLYSKALKGSASLPYPVKTDFNKTMKSIHDCSQKIVLAMDSMSNIFSGPMISVTNNPEVLPYNLLYEIKHQLQLSKKYRDQLFSSINNYYSKECALNSTNSDYINSVEPLTKGVEICQKILNDLSINDSSHISQYIQSLDSLYRFLDSTELTLLKGIRPLGNSKHFKNKGNYNGLDLYTKYEDIINQFLIFSSLGKKFIHSINNTEFPDNICYNFHKEGASQFNSTQGLLYYYNEYVLLIGGGKMKILADINGGSRYIYRGWGDETHSLPVRTLLFWMKETPRFEIEY